MMEATVEAFPETTASCHALAPLAVGQVAPGHALSASLCFEMESTPKTTPTPSAIKPTPPVKSAAVRHGDAALVVVAAGVSGDGATGTGAWAGGEETREAIAGGEGL